MNSTIDVMIMGSCSTRIGIALMMPFTSIRIICAPCSKRIGRLSDRNVKMPSMSNGSCSISIGIASMIPCANPIRSCIPASMSRGAFSIRVFTADIRPSMMVGINVGRESPRPVARLATI